MCQRIEQMGVDGARGATEADADIGIALETRGLLRRVQILLHDRLRDTARKAGGERDQALVMLPQQFHIHAGAVVKPLGKAERNHIAEVPVAHLVFTEQDQMVWLLIDAVNLVKARPART